MTEEENQLKALELLELVTQRAASNLPNDLEGVSKFLRGEPGRLSEFSQEINKALDLKKIPPSPTIEGVTTKDVVNVISSFLEIPNPNIIINDPVINKGKKTVGHQVIDLAVRAGNVKLLQLLLNSGFKTDIPKDGQNSYLMDICSNRMLINGAHVYSSDNMAAMVELLLQNNCEDVNYRNSFGTDVMTSVTQIRYLGYYRELDIPLIHVLLKHGADVNGATLSNAENDSAALPPLEILIYFKDKKSMEKLRVLIENKGVARLDKNVAAHLAQLETDEAEIGSLINKMKQLGAMDDLALRDDFRNGGIRRSKADDIRKETKARDLEIADALSKAKKAMNTEMGELHRKKLVSRGRLYWENLKNDPDKGKSV